jgi:acetoin utilization deacetylase AcuC-like enzyme
MGFCLLNNVAIAAAALTAAGERVLVLDWDVHHGNGTQQIFWNSPDVLYVSTHQWPFYPGSGSAAEVGGWSAIDRTINIPLPSGTTGDLVLRALEEIAAPVIDEFQPTWVLVSAGFDAHRDDPLAELALTGGDFAQLALLAASFAPQPGRLALFLEGGYDLNALRTSVTASLGAVLGVSYEGESRSVGDSGSEFVDHIQRQRLESIESVRLMEGKKAQL